jgi:hypothetical protein
VRDVVKYEKREYTAWFRLIRALEQEKKRKTV